MKVLPALKATLILLVGIVLGRWSNLPFLPLIYLSFILLAISMLPLRRTAKDATVIVALLCSAAASFRSYENATIPERTYLYITAQVEEPPVNRNGIFSFPVNVLTAGKDSVSQDEFKEIIWVKGESNNSITLGSTLSMHGWLVPFRERKNPGDFDLKRWRANQGILGEFRCDDLNIVSPESPLSIVGAARKWINDSCDELASVDAPLWKGLLLGFRRDIDPVLMDDLRVTGLTHLLALSGLNVGFLAFALIGLGSLLRLNMTARMIFAITLVAFYSLIIPDRGSTIRATIMTIVMLAGFVTRRWTPILNSLGVAGMFILAFRPLDLFDPGFELSFAATAGILLFQQDILNIRNWRKNTTGRWARMVRHWILVPFAVSIASSLFVSPLLSCYFSAIPLLGPFFNLLAVPFFRYNLCWCLGFGFAATVWRLDCSTRRGWRCNLGVTLAGDDSCYGKVGHGLVGNISSVGGNPFIDCGYLGRDIKNSD